MNHREEAEKLLYLAYNEISDSEGFFEVQAAFAEATLALVEAQEAANELKRLGLLINIAGHYEDGAMDQACEALTEEHGKSRRFRRDALIALGIGGAE